MIKKILNTGVLMIPLLLASHSPTFADSTGFSFLKLGVGAQAQAMGGAFSAASKDATATYWNPAALSSLDSKEVFAYHNQFIEDFSYSNVAYVQPFKSRKAAFGFAFSRFSQGSFEGRNANREKTSDFSAADNLVTISLGRKITSKAALGVSAKFLQSNLADSSASGALFDISSSYQVSPKTSLALGVFHLGSSLKYENESVNLPSTFSLGLAHKISALTITSDFRQGLNDKKSSLSFGGQLDIGSLASVRAGYVSQIAQNKAAGDKGLDQFAGLGMGMGLKLFKRSTMDYAFLPMGELGSTHHISLSWRFN